MRVLLTWMMAMLTVLSVRAQTHLFPASANYGFWQPSPGYNLLDNGNHSASKWHLNTYTGISAGYGFFNGVGNTYLSAPVGLVLSRPINNNLIAFTSATIAPTLFNINNPSFYHAYPGSNFSVERSSYPVYTSPPVNRKKQ